LYFDPLHPGRGPREGERGYNVRLAAASVKAEAKAKKVQSMQDRLKAMLDGKVTK